MRQQQDTLTKKVQCTDKAIKVLYFLATGFIILLIVMPLVGTKMIEQNMDPE